MSKSITFKQYQLLSAFIDERCNPHEKRRIEAALRTDPELQQTLAEFRRCRKMLRAIPQVKAPHNFTLSPAMVPQKPQRFFLAPALNYGALAAAVIFVFLFAGSRLLPMPTAKFAAAPEAMMAADFSAENTAVPLIIWGGAYGKGGGGGGAEGSGIGGGAPETTAPLMQTNPNDLTSTDLLPEATQSPAAEDATNAVANPSDLILGLPDESVQGQLIAPETEVVSIEPSPRPFRPFSWVLTGEIAFAVLAVGLAIASFFLRKHR